eukprot:scaffold52331_cov45-Attheya_sp.AAC.5
MMRKGGQTTSIIISSRFFHSIASLPAGALVVGRFHGQKMRANHGCARDPFFRSSLPLELYELQIETTNAQPRARRSACVPHDLQTTTTQPRSR